jgi:hypothetical protein
MAMSNTDRNENRKKSMILRYRFRCGGAGCLQFGIKEFCVLLLEAGGEDEPLDYQVPAFHARAQKRSASLGLFGAYVDQQEKDENSARNRMEYSIRVLARWEDALPIMRWS